MIRLPPMGGPVENQDVLRQRLSLAFTRASEYVLTERTKGVKSHDKWAVGYFDLVDRT